MRWRPMCARANAHATFPSFFSPLCSVTTRTFSKPVDPFVLRSKVQVFVDLYLKQAEIQREAELRHRLQEENFRVRAEKLTAEQALRRSQEHQEAMARAEAHQRTLIEELNHRVKNMLTVVNAMARQTLASTPSPQDFADKFVRRIDALGRTHSLLS